VTDDEIRRRVLACLAEVAPDADVASLDGNADLRRECDLDSMDVLNFAVALHEAFAVPIPEADYRRISTLRGCVEYLAAARPAAR
jgi:acyl carrier protein